MIRKVLAVVTLVAALPLAAADVAGVQKSIAALAGTQAQFTQQFTPKGYKQARVESGTVVFGPSPAMRWTYVKPESKAFVFDGNRSWFYVADDRQVTVSTVSDADRAALPFLFLNDPRRLTASYSVSESARGGSITTTLKAKTKAVVVPEIALTRTAAGQLQRLAYTDRQGNRTVFDFSQFQKATPTADTFRFTAPPGVQVVEQ